VARRRACAAGFTGYSHFDVMLGAEFCVHSRTSGGTAQGDTGFVVFGIAVPPARELELLMLVFAASVRAFCK
jgi:hypothetical protein